MDFKGFHAGCSMEPVPRPSDPIINSDAEGRKEGKQNEVSEISFEPTSEMKCIDEMMQTHYL